MATTARKISRKQRAWNPFSLRWPAALIQAASSPYRRVLRMQASNILSFRLVPRPAHAAAGALPVGDRVGVVGRQVAETAHVASLAPALVHEREADARLARRRRVRDGRGEAGAVVGRRHEVERAEALVLPVGHLKLRRKKLNFSSPITKLSVN